MKEQGKYTVSFPKIISSLYLLQGLNLLDLKNVVSMHLITIIGFIFVNLPSPLFLTESFNKEGDTLHKVSLSLLWRCWANRWASLILALLLHHTIWPLTPQIQILPHFGIAEVQAYSLGRWVKKFYSSGIGKKDRSCSRKPWKEFKL